jgi:hypothetical protein
MRDHLRVWLSFPASLGSQLQTGLPVSLNSAVAPDRQVDSHIIRIRPEVTHSSRAINVIIDLDNPGDRQGAYRLESQQTEMPDMMQSGSAQ